MQPHEERVIAEKNELDEKIKKLTVFLDTETFDDLSNEEQILLSNQLSIMEDYSNTLEHRIKLFKE